MDNFLMLLDTYLKGHINAERLKDAALHMYYQKDFFDGVSAEQKGHIESLVLALNMYENEDIDTSPISGIDEEQLKQLVEEHVPYLQQ